MVTLEMSDDRTESSLILKHSASDNEQQTQFVRKIFPICDRQMHLSRAVILSEHDPASGCTLSVIQRDPPSWTLSSLDSPDLPMIKAQSPKRWKTSYIGLDNFIVVLDRKIQNLIFFKTFKTIFNTARLYLTPSKDDSNSAPSSADKSCSNPLT